MAKQFENHCSDEKLLLLDVIRSPAQFHEPYCNTNFLKQLYTKDFKIQMVNNYILNVKCSIGFLFRNKLSFYNLCVLIINYFLYNF